MKQLAIALVLFSCILITIRTMAQRDISQFPNAEISNQFVTMKLLLPDPDRGSYRATRFDWSGIIASLQYEGHEYFAYWKDTYDPLVHEDLSGPVEGYIDPGLGYAEAKPGESFIRIGVGILEKGDEKEYQWTKTYKIIDHGKWKTRKGKDWIEFRHTVNSDFGYGYVYTKRIELKKEEPGFRIVHTLKNTGEKVIETDQFNHNFFTLNRQQTGPGFTVEFPFAFTTEDNLKGLVEIDDNTLSFIKYLDDNSVWMELQGYSADALDHQVTVTNNRTGAGVTLHVDKPIYRMAFWACETAVCPENFILISVDPEEEERWVSDYTLFVNK